jgi:hypothetical protein
MLGSAEAVSENASKTEPASLLATSSPTPRT